MPPRWSADSVLALAPDTSSQRAAAGLGPAARNGAGATADLVWACAPGRGNRDSIFVLVSDLIEGGVREQMLSRISAMHAAGVQVVVLLALSDDGAPAFDTPNAAALAALGVPAFACTPDAFPDLLAVAIEGGDVAAWAHRNDLSAR